jgi:microcompartment protein CcmK/EutM
MKLARVIGTVVATKKEERLEGFKLLLVCQLDPEGKEERGTLVAVDGVGAGIGEVVLVVSGSSARQTDATDKKPVDALIAAIVDTWDKEGKTIYQKE